MEKQGGRPKRNIYKLSLNIERQNQDSRQNQKNMQYAKFTTANPESHIFFGSVFTDFVFIQIFRPYIFSAPNLVSICTILLLRVQFIGRIRYVPKCFSKIQKITMEPNGYCLILIIRSLTMKNISKKVYHFRG